MTGPLLQSAAQGREEDEFQRLFQTLPAVLACPIFVSARTWPALARTRVALLASGSWPGTATILLPLQSQQSKEGRRPPHGAEHLQG